MLKLWAPFDLRGDARRRADGAAGISGDVLRIVFGVLAFVIAANIVLPFQAAADGASQVLERGAPDRGGGRRLSLGADGDRRRLVHACRRWQPSARPCIRRSGTSAAIGVAIAVAGTIGFIVSGWGDDGLPPLCLGYVNLVAFVLVGGLAADLRAARRGAGASAEPADAEASVRGVPGVVGINMIWKAAGRISPNTLIPTRAGIKFPRRRLTTDPGFTARPPMTG